jgi:hypothetical protein
LIYWKDLYDDLAIMLVPLWDQWVEPGSSWHATAYHIDKATAYCHIIHESAPYDVLNASEAVKVQNLSNFKDLALASHEILRFALRSVVKITMKIFAFAKDSTDEFGCFIKLVAGWLNSFAGSGLIDCDNEHWAFHAAAQFWGPVGKVHFVSPPQPTDVEVALQMRGVNPGRPLPAKLPTLVDCTPAVLPTFLHILVDRGLLVWY